MCPKTTRIPKYKTRGFPHWSIMRQLFKISVLWKSQHVSNMDISLDYWIFSWVVAEVEHAIAESSKMYSPLIWKQGILTWYIFEFFFGNTFLGSKLEKKTCNIIINNTSHFSSLDPRSVLPTKNSKIYQANIPYWHVSRMYNFEDFFLVIQPNFFVNLVT